MARLIGADALIIDLMDRGIDHLQTEDWSEIQQTVADAPTVDAVPVVRCKDCKHRILNEHYGEKGFIKLKAYCELDTGDIFSLGRNAENDNWFCADGKRKGGDE